MTRKSKRKQGATGKLKITIPRPSKPKEDAEPVVTTPDAHDGSPQFGSTAEGTDNLAPQSPKDLLYDTIAEEIVLLSPPPPAKKKKAVTASLVQEESPVEALPEQKVVLLIPQVTSDGTQRKNVTTTTPYNEVLSIIYDTIGCTDVQRKPNLQYKLSNAAQKATPISLGSEDDWQGCLEDLLPMQTKKKALIPISIIVGEQYMLSLKSRAKDGKAGVKGVSGRLKPKMAVLDLDHEDGDDDEGGGDDLMEKERKAMAQLEHALTKCQACGLTKFCKIGKDGLHHNLTFNQRRGWCIALATGTHNVTLKTPPKGELFTQFHSGISVTASTSAPALMEAQPSTMPFPMMGGMMSPFGIPPWMMPSFSGYPITPTPSHQNNRSDVPSSDPPEDNLANPYPDIGDFITKLHELHSRRNLVQYITDFEMKDYYNINELANLTEERLSSNEFGMSPGNASFLLGAVRTEIKRIDRNKGKHARK